MMRIKVTEALRRYVVCIWIFIAVFAGTGTSLAAPSQRQYQEAILLESANQGWEGMYAVACVFRNRRDAGLPFGSSAVHRRDSVAFVERQPRRVRDMATHICTLVFTHNSPDITGGATHFESTDFGRPWWADHMVRTGRIGKHVFYKEVRNVKKG